MALPIVLIHTGNSDYLPYSLAQAKTTNPDSTVHLIGDYRNNHYKFVEHHSIRSYTQTLTDFTQVYQHFSTLPIAFEIFCFQRWIILSNFMTLNNIEKCLYIDSDVMIYTNVSDQQPKFEPFSMTFSSGLSVEDLDDSISPHCTFINCAETLREFARFLIDLYTKAPLLNLMKEQFEKRIHLGGGACDMTAFHIFHNAKLDRIGFTSDIETHEGLYDTAISSSNSVFEMQNGMKKIYMVDGQPFCNYRDSDKTARFNILHFQGSAKPYMKDYFTGHEIQLNRFIHQSLIIQSKIEKKLKRYFKLS